LRTRIPELGDAVLAPLRRGSNLTLELDGNTLQLVPEDVLISTEQAAEWICGDDAGIQVAISTVLTPALIREGMSRDFVRQIQQLRKDAGLNIQDRIRIHYAADEAVVREMVAEWQPYIAEETLALTITEHSTAPSDAKSIVAGDSTARLWIEALG